MNGPRRGTPSAAPGTTLTDVRRDARGGVGRWGRRGGTVVLALVVLAGALGLLGVRSGTVSAAAGGYHLSVTYAQVARAGLDVPFHVRVGHAGGFDGGVTLAITASYFGLFETQGFYPDPQSETNDGTDEIMTFAKPPGDTFQLDFDAYIQPASQVGRSGTVRLVRAGATVARVSVHTRLVP
jgi:hypothetical protein